MVLTEKQDTSFYPAATMETAQATTEEALYANLPETRTAISTVAGYPTDSTTSPNNEVAEVSGSGQKIGPAIVLKVMAGDKFNIKVSSWYRSNGVTPHSRQYIFSPSSFQLKKVSPNWRKVCQEVKGWNSSFTCCLTNESRPLIHAVQAECINHFMPKTGA